MIVRISDNVQYKRLTNGMEIEDPKWKPSVFSLPWFLLIIFGGLLYFLYAFQVDKYAILEPTKGMSIDMLIDQTGFSINTPGCRIPDLDPFDDNVKEFISKPKPPICNSGIPPLIGSNTTSIFVNNDSLPLYNITNMSDIQCCYQEFWRVQPKPKSSDKGVTYAKECKYFNESATITSEEFIKVTCVNNSNASVVEDYFAFVPIRSEFSSINMVTPPTNPKLNVLVIGLDAVSRVNLHRQMPKTVNYLSKIGAVELLGYNKVADNTFPNLIPVLSGIEEGEFKNSCWPEQDNNFDPCYFMWQDYRKEGYVTVYGEDASWMGMFNYLKNGFLKQPTDYYYGYFNREIESNIGNSHNMNVYECEGARDVYKDFLLYVYKFATKMESEKLPYFGFFWGSSLSHDYLNKPSLGDDFYVKFFKSLKDGGLLENTALIFMSDHGIRWGPIRQTYQGRLEERLPFVFPVLPEWFKQKYQVAYANLKRNTRRLTTPFDLHETLLSFLHLEKLEDDVIRERSGRVSRGYTFFDDISNKRTCDDAGISSHWCTCQESQSISVNDTLVKESAEYAVQHMNSQLKGYAQCAELRLSEILNAQLMLHGEHIVNGDNKTRDVLITLKTVPGDGLYETTVRKKGKTSGKDEPLYKVIGTISRLDLYGEKSSCITDFHLKLYCYCKSLLEKSIFNVF